MNASFTFPRPQPPVPRPAPVTKILSSQSPDLAGSRESNALRASILDTALELGIGSNSLVTDWMFNNPLTEEIEEEREAVPSPGLTYGSPTSEESALSSLLHSQYRRDPAINVNGNGGNFNINQNVKKSNGPLIFQRRDASAVGSGRISDADSQSYIKIHFNASEVSSNLNFQTIDNGVAPFDIPITPRPTTPSGKKLKKKRVGGDGYESDGGYVSESGKKKDKKKDKKKEDSGEGFKEEEERKTKKSFIQVTNKTPVSNDIRSPIKGHETDRTSVYSSSKSKSKIKKSRPKTPSTEIGYDTDGRDLSSSGTKKSKARFFKLPTKSSKCDDASDSMPALPNFAEKKNEPIVPLPIAERFATTLSSGSIFSHLMSSSTTMEGEGSPLPALSFLSFEPTSELTTGEVNSEASAEPSTFNRPATAPTASSPSAFIANVTLLHPKNRDSRSSVISSSSSASGSNHQPKSQKRFGLFSPPPSSMQGHQQHGLRTAWSMSSLKPPHPVISLPITRSTSPTPAGQLSSSPLLSHSRSVSPLSPYVSPTTPVAPLQINKTQRNKHHPDHLSFPTPQAPGSAMVRPRNPPTDGFGPRLTPTLNSGPNSTPRPSLIPSSSNSDLSSLPYTQGLPRRLSQLSIIPSSDYIVPSPRNSPSKAHHTQGLPGPLPAYYHHDHIPPPSPAPMGPLPTLPSNGNVSLSGPNGNSVASAGQFPSSAQLRQRMNLMRQSVQHDHGIRLEVQKGDPVFPLRPVLSPSQSTVTNGSVSVCGLGQETLHRYHDLGNNGVELSAVDNAKHQEKEIAADVKVTPNRRSWIDIEEDISLDESEIERQEAEESDDLYDILDRFETRSNKSGDSNPGGQALEISHSPKAGKFEEEQHQQHQQHHFDSFDARPRRNNRVPADVYGFEEDGRTIGDRTSRWSGSVYSNTSILCEDESEETRDRFVRRVEAMLDVEKKMAKNRAHAHDMGGGGGGSDQPAQAYIPPIPKMPDAYAHVIRKPNTGNINQHAGPHSNTTPRRSWNKF